MIGIKRVDRLIANSVLGSIGIVWVVLIGIDSFTALAREVDEIGRGSYTIASALGYIAWTIPRRAYDLFGIAAVIGALLGLGALAPTGEITAMRAGGMSKLRICLGALAAAAIATVLVAIGGETIAPWGEHRAQALAAGAKSEDLIVARRTGIWAREGETLINARRGELDGTTVVLHDVRIYEFTRAGQLERISRAKRAEHRSGEWSLHDVLRQSFGADTVANETVARMRWPSKLDPKLLTLSVMRPRYLAAADLAAGIDYMRRNELDAGSLESAFWARVFYPLNVLAIVLAALPFAFGALRSGGLGKRLFLGIVIATAWFLFQRAIENLASVYAIDFRIVHVLPAALLVAAAATYFRRAA